MASKICTFHPFFLAPQALDLALLAAVTAIDSLALLCTGSTVKYTCSILRIQCRD